METHVDGHAAALMNQTGVTEGTLFVNNPEGIGQVRTQLPPRMLPPGVGLEVVFAQWQERYAHRTAMMLTFFDMHDESNPQNGVGVYERGDLLKMLESFRDKEPFFAELVGENAYKLTIGIGNMGCVQHSRSDGEPPYLMAVEPATAKPGAEQKFQEFLAGNESTEVPVHYLLPFERVKEIAAYFQGTGERSPAVSWEELRPDLGH